MAKKVWTDEERKAFGEKMRASRRAKHVEVKGPVAEPVEKKEPETTYNDADIAALIRQVEELKAQNYQPQSNVSVSGGKLIGTVEKYSVNPAKYPSPVERLTNEPKLQRFAFPLNYELQFKVEVSSYQTQDGINTKEPRFTLQLIKIVMDEDTYEPTNKRYMLYQLIFHEDPQAAIQIANEHGIPVDEDNEADFLNEMRYLMMRDWLFQLAPFYPQKAESKKNKRQEVIGNRIVEVYEVSSEQKQAIPFGEINSKL